MKETTLQHVSTSKLSCISFIDRSFLPMVPLAPLALPFVPPVVPLNSDTIQGSMVATFGTPRPIPRFTELAEELRMWSPMAPLAKLPMVPLAEP